MKKINYETCIYLAKENSDTKIYETKNKIRYCSIIFSLTFVLIY